MKGTVHAAIGASTPAGLVLTGHVTPLQGLVMGAISAGFALLPDIDTPNALASKALGGFVHRVVHRLCKAILNATATGCDRSDLAWQKRQKHDPVHRTVTHTLASFALLAAAAYLIALVSLTGVAILAAFGVFLLWPLFRGPGPRKGRALRVAVLVGLAAGAILAAPTLLTPWLLALAIGGGYLSHLAADACTSQGVPALWPMKINGKRWWKVRALGSMVASGSPRERGPALGVSITSNGLLLFLTL